MDPHRGRFFFFNDTATTEIYTLSLHDALPISPGPSRRAGTARRRRRGTDLRRWSSRRRSEEHTSELQSQSNLVCRLLLEKKKSERRSTSSRYRPGDRERRSLGACTPTQEITTG